MVVMQWFLADFLSGFETGRYRAEASPDLDFRDDEFDLALVSTCLFTDWEQLSTDFYVCAIEEMCRVATEARIFPLLKSYGGTTAPATRGRRLRDGLAWSRPGKSPTSSSAAETKCSWWESLIQSKYAEAASRERHDLWLG